MNWTVDVEPRVYAEWLATDPPVWKQEAMRGWFKGCELNGPPAIIDYSRDRFPIAAGPNGERIEFADVALPLGLGSSDGPPYGFIAIRRIS